MMGVFNGLANVVYETAIQQRFPHHLMGRIMGALAPTYYGLFLLAVALASVAVGRYGPSMVIVAGGGVIFAAVVAALLSHDMREL